MSSLARLTLRTTAAAAGIAAIGAGLAAPALAAPELPAAPSSDGPGSLPAAPAAGMLGSLPAAPSASHLPTLVSFEMPKVSTAGPELPSAGRLPAAPAAPALPSAGKTPSLPRTDGITNVEGANHVNTPASDVAPGNNDAGALASMDTAKTMAGMAQKATSGDSMLQGNSFG